ncbi:hypothetical protein AB833_18000 [Chromatiales bacterium (ex Bugula neritina AB1)]|nr:hypothetical protein AB833_18000 [Chromatiales bacterium (ex Bugula neritina AB1)]
MTTEQSIHILVAPNVHLLDLAGPAQVFASPKLNCSLCYISSVPVLSAAQGLSLTHFEPLPGTVAENTWLVVVGSFRMAEQLLSGDLDATVGWLKGMSQMYSRVAAVCSGSLLLARAGLLEGVRCTTHHDLVDQLQSLARGAMVRENRLFVEDGRYLTSAGISTGIDLSLHLVAQRWGAAVAQAVARDMVVYQRRRGDSDTLSFWLQHRNHIEQKIHDIQDQITGDPGYKWRLSVLAEVACLSERQFRRRFEQATGIKVQEYIRRARLELSKQLLTQTELDLNRIAERCGFSDERSLRRVWQQLSGVSPGNYRKSSAA